MRAAAPTSAALRGRSMPFLSLAMTLGLVLSAVRITAPPPTFAEHTPNPTSVTIAGDLQSELGCTFDWDAGCATTHLSHDANDDVWQGTWTVPAGSWEYKAALNDNWDENYGLHAQPNGANIPLAPGSATSTKFYYDHKTHWITDSLGSVIAVAPGNFQSEIGCSSDWDPSCLRSWLQDPDGDGTYLFVTTAIAAGSYEAKVAINEGWDENYGRDGVFNGPNIPFNVPATGNEVTFSYVAATHILTISVAGVHAPDNNVEWFGLRHDSRSDVYRTPGGAVPAGTPVALRFRTFHNDVTAVKTRFYSVQQGGQQIVPMELAAGGIGCYEPGLEDELCDFWELTLPEEHGADNLWYRFIVSDGTDTDYYADDTPALDGGLGATTDDAVDQSWALMLHVPGFESPTWAPHAVIYQIFPDRFRNGRANNDPHTGDLRYDDPVLKLPWGTLPEGFCRNYADGNVNCPWRFDDTPPPSSPTKEQPRGRDYMGGDLRGVDQQLGYLATLGVSAIYFNPVFDAGSNHSYDTQDYTRIDPYFGTAKDWENLVKHADALGIRIILDGVFNHLSSDSPFFDRYHHYPSVGACEDENSAYRSWFFFQDVAPGSGHCVSSTGAANGALYSGWFGFDSIPVINKGLQAVQEYFLTDEDAITARWLEDGASGWRMDVSGDPSFPDGYWETFRAEVDESDPDALTISETWQKDSTLLRMLRGDRLDTTMNYRLRDAVIGFLTPGPFDSKGFADSGNVISANDFANRLAAIREDYPDAAYYSLMNLLDSHDTERLLWTLTPGAETRAEKELNAANLAAGKARMRVASLIQFTVPGAPTVYYGDEVGMTGDDDPDDRRTYPWADKGGSPDTALLAYYQGLTAARAENPALTEGDFRVLLADDSSGTVAYGRKTDAQGALVALNRSSATQTLELQVSGYLPDGLLLDVIIAANAPSGGSYAVSGGELSVSLPAMSGLVLASGEADLQPPAAPTDLSVTDEAANQVSLAWDPVSGAAGYDVYYSPLSGGGYVKANGGPVTGTSFTVTGLQNARPYFFVVTALDSAGNASQPSNEVEGIPHLVIGWANLQWPPTMMHTISTVDRTDTAYGQVWIDGPNGTSQPGPTPSLRAQLGFGPAGSNPTAASWTWVEASFNVDAGNNDEFAASMLPEAVGTYHYVYRYTATAGRDWLYADLNGPIPSGELPANPGVLTVNPSGDTTAPAVPTALLVESASPAGIELSWEAVLGDASLYGYEVGRA
ncbi:MAG TPA: alpha-amylase family glycosyl hydrolase, partial [Candidatus Limnocylindria bacterium]